MSAPKFAIVADIVEPGKGIGYVHPNAGMVSEAAEEDGGLSFRLTDEGARWVLFGGISDEVRAEGPTLDEALCMLAAEVRVTGVAEIQNEVPDGGRRRWEVQLPPLDVAS